MLLLTDEEYHPVFIVVWEPDADMVTACSSSGPTRCNEPRAAASTYIGASINHHVTVPIAMPSMCQPVSDHQIAVLVAQSSRPFTSDGVGY